MMATDDLAELSKSVLSLQNHIPQCKLCPENLDYIQFSASTEKPKIKKIRFISLFHFSNLISFSVAGLYIS